jgi:hypothetical protein
MIRSLLLVVAVALGVAGCNSEDNGGAVDIGEATDTSRSSVSSAVVVEVRGEGDEVLRQGSVSCTDTDASGTGAFLEDPVSEEACRLLDDAAIVTLLTEGPDDDRSCTEIYGGPETATVSGRVRGSDVEASFDRADGCGIADWDLLAALLGAPAS